MAHCWVLFGRVEGLKLNEAKLARLIQVCRKYWNSDKWDIYGINLGHAAPWSEHGYDIHQSPLVMPAIQKAIDSAKIERLRGSNVEFHRLPSHFKNIPLEVAILITECVCPVKYTVDDIKDEYAVGVSVEVT